MILTNARIFTGKEWIEGGSVSIADGMITQVDTGSEFNSEAYDCKNNMLVPAFLDLQIYGAGGRLFAVYPDKQSLETLARENRKGGVAGCLVTIATQPADVIYACVEATRNYLKENGDGILGMHLEGPFINPGKRGAHVQQFVHAPAKKEVEDLLLFADGAIKMVTLAPEVCDPAVIGLFKEAGVVISAGHSNATYDQAMKAPLHGVTTVTHLFNAMSPFHHRDTGLPGAAFENKNLHASIIPDGIHVSYAALRIAKQLMGERLFFITDAVTETATGTYPHQLHDDRYCMPDGTLSGSAISMLQGVKNAVEHAGIPLEEAIRMAGLYPAMVMGLSLDYGTIAVGKKASMLLLNTELEIVESFLT